MLALKTVLEGCHADDTASSKKKSKQKKTKTLADHGPWNRNGGMEMEERLQEMGTKQSCCETSQASVRVNQYFEMFICLLAGTNKEEEEKMKETAKKKKKNPRNMLKNLIILNSVENVSLLRRSKIKTKIKNRIKFIWPVLSNPLDVSCNKVETLLQRFRQAPHPPP